MKFEQILRSLKIVFCTILSVNTLKMVDVIK